MVQDGGSQGLDEEGDGDTICPSNCARSKSPICSVHDKLPNCVEFQLVLDCPGSVVYFPIASRERTCICPAAGGRESSGFNVGIHAVGSVGKRKPKLHQRVIRRHVAPTPVLGTRSAEHRLS